MAAQEVLLCTADRLAQVADSVGTLKWHIDYSYGATSLDLNITVPPQATDDRFIARDMALNVLAGLAQVALRPGYGTGPAQSSNSCTERYLAYAANPIWGSDPSLANLFDAQFRADGSAWDPADAYAEIYNSDGSPKTKAEAAEVVNRRLKLQANVLAGAARLAKKLVEDSVRDDMAGAERARAGAGDPLEGARRMWGAPDPDDPSRTLYYDSLRHALKVLFGRLELSPNREVYGNGQTMPVWNVDGKMIDDPECMGWAASEVLDALGPETSARWNDTPPRTPQQALALNLLETAGIVMLPLSSGMSALKRQAITNQLLLLAADSQNLTPAEFDVADNPMATAMRDTLESLSDEDLLFALNRNYEAFRLIIGYEPATMGTPRSAAIAAGLPLAPVDVLFNGLFGAAIEGGVPRRVPKRALPFKPPSERVRAA